MMLVRETPVVPQVKNSDGVENAPSGSPMPQLLLRISSDVGESCGGRRSYSG